MAGFVWTRAPCKTKIQEYLTWAYCLEYMSMQLRSNRAGGDIDSESLRWRLSSFKGAPILCATYNMALNSKRMAINDDHGSTGLFH